MVNDSDMSFCGGGFIWAFLIFALLMGNGGFGFGNNAATALGYENLATSNEVQRGFDNQNAMANQREILSAVTDGTAQSVAASNQVYHDLASNISDKYSELARDIAGVNAGVSQAIANQCQLTGDLKLQMAEGFGQNRFDSAMNTAAINATTTAQTQKILDAISQNKIETLQNKVNFLETQNLLGNVVRYPTQMSYNAGPSPFCGCGGGYNGYPLYV
jgi:hypothetical protein